MSIYEAIKPSTSSSGVPDDIETEHESFGTLALQNKIVCMIIQHWLEASPRDTEHPVYYIDGSISAWNVCQRRSVLCFAEEPQEFQRF